MYTCMHVHVHCMCLCLQYVHVCTVGMPILLTAYQMWGTYMYMYIHVCTSLCTDVDSPTWVQHQKHVFILHPGTVRKAHLQQVLSTCNMYMYMYMLCVQCTCTHICTIPAKVVHMHTYTCVHVHMKRLRNITI